MFALKPISHDSVAGALAKAERYRLLNEPSEAESICRDILEVDPANRHARISLILALTDEIPQDERRLRRAMAAIAGLESAYDRAYYAASPGSGAPRHPCSRGGTASSGHVYEWIVKALQSVRRSGAPAARRQRRRGPALERLRSLSRSPQRPAAGNRRCTRSRSSRSNGCLCPDNNPGCPISRSFFARCGIPQVFPSNSKSPISPQGITLTCACQNAAFCPVGSRTVTWQSYSPGGSLAQSEVLKLNGIVFNRLFKPSVNSIGCDLKRFPLARDRSSRTPPAAAGPSRPCS